MAADKKKLAFEAGRQAYLSEPPERRTLDGNPFDPHTETDERAAWIDGISDALESTPSDAELREQIKEARDA